jgi:hypothetical protein
MKNEKWPSTSSGTEYRKMKNGLRQAQAPNTEK